MDQVRALENEMLENIKKQGLHMEPKILVVCLIIASYQIFLRVFLDNYGFEAIGSICEGNTTDSRCRGDAM